MFESTEIRVSRRLAGVPGSAFLAALLIAGAAGPGCRKSEAPAGGSAAAPTAGPTVAAADVPPDIRDSAETGKPPFSGLAEPRGLAMDGRGRLWVTDFGHSRVAIFDAAGGTLGVLGGTKGNGTYQLSEPAAVAIGGDDVYVADTWNGRVQRFDLSGRFKETTATGLYGPRGVAIAADGTVWATDTGNNRVAALRKGEPVRYLGKAGSGPDGFSSPVGIAIGPSGTVYVVDCGNHRIQVIDAGVHFGRPIPVAGWASGMEPFLEVDQKESIYASLPSANGVVQLDRSGKVVKRWDADENGKIFARPTGLALDRKNGLLYVSNTAANSITRIKLTAAP